MAVHHQPTLRDGYYDLGTYGRPVTASNPEAQAWFNRGLIWSYAFNFEEASRCFERAITHGPDTAMAYWGLAYSLGPNYNKPWDLFGKTERASVIEKTHRAVEQARAKAHTASPVERALIDALHHRYPKIKAPTKTDCSVWNREYADAMSSVFAAFPDDLDVATLYADAMMNLTPWQLWDLKTGDPASGARTLEVQRVLHHALSLKGGMDHPGLLHLQIHFFEMSRTPELAMPAANKLRGLVPDAGHLNHMPSHLDILLGDYSSAIEANTNAIRADEKFLAREGPMNFYTLYRSHNYHFRLYAAMFSGQSRIALDTVAMLESTISDDLLRIESPPMADWLESFLAMRVHALIRFGKWKDILALRLPADQELYCVTTTFTHYAKGMAFAAMGKVTEADQQRTLYRKAVPRVKPTRTLFNNKCVDILGVATALLDGEIEYRSANYEIAFAHLREAIDKYDNLPFDEPWGWMQPTRHAYGALLLEQGHVEEALAVYQADLGLNTALPRTHRHPNNVWGLHGLHECLQRLGRMGEARAIEPQLKAALALADVPITSSCFCRLTCAKI
jgi:tetratricopeptide (TPR) repeat protein